MRLVYASVLLAIAACSADSSREDFDRDAGRGASDGAQRIDAGAGVPSPYDAAQAQPDAGVSDGEFGGPADPALGCFNDVDDNADGLLDCADPSCRANVPACCVGVVSALCCAAVAENRNDFMGCDGPIEECTTIAADFTSFGSPSPYVITADDGMDIGALVPGGQATDSGIVRDDAVDVRQASVTVRARIAASGTPHDVGADSVGIGFARAGSRTSAAVGVLVSGARAEARVIVGGEVLQRWPLSDDGFVTYEVTWRPDGTVEVQDSAGHRATLDGLNPSSVHAIVWGRTSNTAPGGVLPARALDFAVLERRCDMPSALSGPPSGVDVRSTVPGWPSSQLVGRPSVARNGTRLRAAIAIDGVVHLAAVGSDGALDVLTTPTTPAFAIDGATLSLPVLREGEQGLELWATATTNGRGSIVRVRAAGADPVFRAEDAVTVAAIADASLEAAAPFTRGDRTYAIVAVRRDSVQFVLAEMEPFRELAVIHRARTNDLAAFDRDAIAAPMVVTAGNVLRLYYAGRRGARWSIGLLVSHDGVSWVRTGATHAILGGRGDGFDGLGARDPGPYVDPARGVIDLYYVGDDGRTSALGLATGYARE